MVERWIRLYFGAAKAICTHGQQQHTLSLSRPLRTESDLLQNGIALHPGAARSSAKCLNGDVTTSSAFREGRVRFQDEGSQLVAEIMGRANRFSIAAPRLAARRSSSPSAIRAQIVSCDSSEPRLAHLRKRLAPFGDRIECRLADAAALTNEAVYDLVLVDAPCSGTGTLGRNPEIRHRLQPEEFARQAERQRAILTAAIRAARPGGRVVYSTCSIEPEENEEVIVSVLAVAARARTVICTSASIRWHARAS